MSLRGAVSAGVRLLRSPAAIYLIASGLARLGAIVLIPLYTRKLSPADYGDYALAQTVISVLPTIASLGLLSAIPRAFFNEKNREEGMRAAAHVSTWTIAVVLTHSAALLGLVAVIAEPATAALEDRWILSCVIVAAAGSALTSIPAVLLRSAQRPFHAGAWQLLEFGAVAASGIVLVGVFHRGVQGTIEALALSYGTLGAMAAGFVVVRLRGRLRGGIVRNSLLFAFPFVPHFIANWSQLAADRWILKAFGYEGELGRYVLATQLALPVSMVVAAFNDAESARTGELFRAGGLSELRVQFRVLLRRYFLAAAVPGAVVVGALPALPYITGPAFRSSLTLVPLVLVVALIDVIYFPATNVVYFAGRTRLIPVVTIAGAVVNLLLNLLLIPSSGVSGALLARAGGYAVRSGAMSLAAHRCFAGGVMGGKK
jgi:O-antigen/teichoic acid export membrane protein